MQFAAPVMLAGAAAISIPIVLHLFYRARYKPLPWAPMHFLRQAIEQTSRRLRFQEWLLLLLRCLVILLLALALARPGWSGYSASSRSQAVDAVFLVDVSYSMGAMDGEVSRLERARQAAQAVLDTLPPLSSIQIVTFADRAWLLGPQQRSNWDQARQILKGLEPTALSTDLLPGLEIAWEALQSGTAAAKELYIFTDLQRLGWERQVEMLRSKMEQLRQLGPVVLVQCAHPQRQPTNVSIEAVQWVGVIPHTRTRVPFTVLLRNTGNVPVRGVKVFLEIDGLSVENDAVQVDQIEPGQTYPVTLTGGLKEAGVRLVQAKVSGDELPGDNLHLTTLFVRDKVRVLLVDGTPNPDDPVQAGDHFVRTALNPTGNPDYFIETESVSALEVGPRHLDGKDVVYLLNAPVRSAENPLRGLSQEFLEGLDRFVRRGGGLVIACGDQVDPGEYTKVLGPSGRDLLPLPLQGYHITREEAPYRLSAPSVATDSFLADFRKPGYAEALERLALFRMISVVEPKESGPGRVLIRDTDGRPYLLQRAVGAGEVLLVTSSLDERWCNFSADPGSFHVPLAMLIIKHLTARQQAGGVLTAGQTLTWTVPPTVTNEVWDILLPPPRGRTNPERVTIPLQKDGNGQRHLTWTETFHAGVYRLVPQGLSAETPAEVTATFAVNPDLRESTSLVMTNADELRQWLGFSPTIIPAGADTATAVTQLRIRGEWTEYLLVGLLLLLVVESTWAWLCGRAW